MCLQNGRFPLERKKPMFSLFIRTAIDKVLETIIQFHFQLFVGKSLNAYFMTLCLIFSKNDLLSSNQFVFRPGDSCITHLFSVNHEILHAFDMELEVHGIFLNISKALDKVWHDGLIFKLRQNGICGGMINILEDFLSIRRQRVVLNGQCSSWVDIRAGVP